MSHDKHMIQHIKLYVTHDKTLCHMVSNDLGSREHTPGFPVPHGSMTALTEKRQIRQKFKRAP